MSTYTGNSRLKLDNLGNRQERVAIETHIFYQPASPQEASIVWQGQRFLTSADGLTVGDAIDGREGLSVQLMAIAMETYDAGLDPITGADLSNISPAGVANIIRAVYNKEHNKKFGGQWDSQDYFTEVPEPAVQPETTP